MYVRKFVEPKQHRMIALTVQGFGIVAGNERAGSVGDITNQTLNTYINLFNHNFDLDCIERQEKYILLLLSKRNGFPESFRKQRHEEQRTKTQKCTYEVFC